MIMNLFMTAEYSMQLIYGNNDQLSYPKVWANGSYRFLITKLFTDDERCRREKRKAVNLQFVLLIVEKKNSQI